MALLAAGEEEAPVNCSSCVLETNVGSGACLLNGGQAEVASSLQDLLDKGSWNKAGCVRGEQFVFYRLSHTKGIQNWLRHQK